MKKLAFLLIVTILATGCSTKNIFKPKLAKKSETKSEKITMKTKKITFSDTGFYKNNSEYIQLQVYEAGVAVANMKFYKNEDKVCVGYKCSNKKYFKDNFLSKYYPNNLIINILTKKPILDGKNLQKTADGFIQTIKNTEYDISYKTTTNSIYFKDRQNKILIKLKDL